MSECDFVTFILSESYRIGWDTVATMAYGDRFRKHRRLMSQVLNSQAVAAYRDLQVNYTKILLKDLLDSPAKFDHHLLRSVIKLILTAKPYSITHSQPSKHYCCSSDVRAQR